MSYKWNFSKLAPAAMTASALTLLLACGQACLGQESAGEKKPASEQSGAKRPAEKPADKPAEKAAPYFLPSPKGWSKERINLPPGFAPEMTWKGHEDLRFAPGMFKSKEEDFFSYLVLFWIEGKPDLSDEKLKVELKEYYQGLCNAVLRSRAPNQVPEIVVVKFQPTAKPKTKPTEGGEKPAAEKNATAKAAYKPGWRKAQLRWTEPFATGKPQVLNLEINRGVVGDHSAVILLVSPSKKEAIWKTLRKMAGEIKFKR